METINRFHPEITQKSSDTLAAYIKMENGSIHFSEDACVNFGITSGLFAHFVNDDDRWYFYVNRENDGWGIVTHPLKMGAFIFSESLSILIQKRTKQSLFTKFPVKRAHATLHGRPILEICFNKPIN